MVGLLVKNVQAQPANLLQPDAVRALMNRVAEWQINEWQEGRIIKLPKTEWENGALYTGMVALQALEKKPRYDRFLYQTGEECDWNTGKERFFADDYCVAQLYTAMYDWHKEPKMIAAWQALADSIVSKPFNESLEVVPQINHREWAWCDALFMGPPSLASLSKVLGNPRYLQKADSLWWKTTAYLYSKEDSLFYRDSRFFQKQEANGKKVFWSRGNGWVIAGIVRMLDNMPPNFEHRDKYVTLFQEMAHKIASLQQPDGSWHASLYDPVTFSAKETSGTAFFCYGLTWGVNHGLLPKETYLPVIQRAWVSLMAAVHPNGKLGYVQNIGDKPVTADYESTNVYGVGGLLLAGSEIYQLHIGPQYDIRDFGAVGDGQQINTRAIQAAIDSSSRHGGSVLIPKGTFLSGTLYLPSYTHIEIAEGGILKGSPYFKDYPVNQVAYKNGFVNNFNGKVVMTRALLFAEGSDHIRIYGKGTVDGHGDAAEFQLGNDGESAHSKERPCALLLINCKDISVQDLFMTNPAYWLQNYIGCDGLHLKGLRIYNHTNYNQDGMDIDARNVLVEDCHIDVDDDGICFKSQERAHVVQHVLVRNCDIGTNCNGIKFGTTSIGGLEDVQVMDCTIHKASEDRIRNWQKNLQFIDQPVTVLSGIALESVDGAIVDGIDFNRIHLRDVQTPIFIVISDRNRQSVDNPVTYRKGAIRNIRIRNVDAVGHSKMPSSITGFPGCRVENVSLEHISLNEMGTGTSEDARLVLPESKSGYPENRMYGLVYPASGLYVRHVQNIHIMDMEIQLRNMDARPVVVLEDVHTAFLDQLKLPVPQGGTPKIRVSESTYIHGVN
ncbi:Rhamnogalacturonyl hydrolase YesR [bacterium A37T11]|nr:Rhamnogalacturonyl hydrolase YesR [bacterium A37T11]